MNVFEGVEGGGALTTAAAGATGNASKKRFPRTGVAYVAAMEHEYMNSQKLSICANCLALGFDKPLKRCAGCGMVDYCGKECQKAQWKKHKPFCNLTQGKGSKSAYLAAQPPEMVQQILVDAYRLRSDIDHTDGNCDHGIWYDADGGRFPPGVVWAKGDVYADFQRWLDLAEQSGILPDWFQHVERMQTMILAVDEKAEESIWKSVDQSELIKRYEGDVSMRSAMLVLAELVVGYEGTGPAKDDKWYIQFSENLDLHPEERARLIKKSVEEVRRAFEEHGLGEEVKSK